MNLKVYALSFLVGVTGVALAPATASASIACNAEHECWHTTENLTYPKGITVHDDNWKWRGKRYHWHEHDGRGYWKGGVWVTL